MIIGRNTNHLYFSDLLRSNKTYRPAWLRIQHILDKHHISYSFLKGTNSIWCRDYMPAQIDKNRFVQFLYNPGYLKEDPHLRSDPVYVNHINGFKPQFNDTNLDGGNIVSWSDRVMISERIFIENLEKDRHLLVAELEQILEAEVIIIPCLGPRNDMTGHADGYARFVDAHTLIGNDRNFEYSSWSIKMNRVLNERGLTYIDMPVFEDSANEKGVSAIGCYVNYLEIKNLIIMPVFEVKGNKDTQAYDIMKSTFPDRIIETVNINEIGSEGGLMNCISWNIEV